jgi:hypothetical protein
MDLLLAVLHLLIVELSNMCVGCVFAFSLLAT